MLHFDIEQSTGIAVAPYLVCFFVSVGAGLVADAAIRRGLVLDAPAGGFVVVVIERTG